MSVIMVPALKCTVSPKNVRKTADHEADLLMRASIVARGVIQNLVGFPKARKKGEYEITAGGRRLTQVHAAIADGSLPATFEIPFMPLADKNDAMEISLAENFIRANMTPADECIAFKHIIETEKKTPADVAKRFGLTERFVLGRLRLASLADEVFTALRDLQITLDLAMAYASTSDVGKQAEVFRTYGASAHPATIRRVVQTIGYRGTAPRVQFIDRAAYEAAGGRVDGDLFTDDAEEMWLDSDIVDRLAMERLEEIAAATKVETGYFDVRVVEQRGEIWNVTRDLVQLPVTIPPLSEADDARLEAIAEELEALEHEANGSDDGLTEEQEASLAALQAEYERLTNPEIVLTDDQKARAIAFIYLGSDGQPRIESTLYTEPEPEPVRTPGNEAGTDGEAGDATTTAGTPIAGTQGYQSGTVTPTEPEKPGLSQRLAAELAMQKTELVALHVANDPHFAFDLGVFIMADRALAEDHRNGIWSDLPTELRAGAALNPAPDFKSDTQAAEGMTQIREGLDKTWFTSRDATERFDAFRQLGGDAKAAWLGWTVARTLRAVEGGKPGAGFIDHLGGALGIDVAAWWRPTATNYFDRVSKATTLEALREVGGSELSNRYGSSKKAELAAAAERLFAGNTIVEPEYRAAIVAWVPAAMRVATPSEVPDDEIETAEAGPDTTEPGCADGPSAELVENGVDASDGDGSVDGAPEEVENATIDDLVSELA